MTHRQDIRHAEFAVHVVRLRLEEPVRDEEVEQLSQIQPHILEGVIIQAVVAKIYVVVERARVRDWNLRCLDPRLVRALQKALDVTGAQPLYLKLDAANELRDLLHLVIYAEMVGGLLFP